MYRLLSLVLLWAVWPIALDAQQTIAQHTRGMEKRDGYFPLYWDATKGRLLLEVPRLDQEFLYLTSLVTGLGSNALGLDRGLIGDEWVARFERVGPKALFVLTNPSFRASGDNVALSQSVTESFGSSTVAAFSVSAEENGRVLLDVTEYFLGDAMDAARQLRRVSSGRVAVERERSTIFLPRTKAFPDNTEIEAAVTFSLENPGAEVRRHTPDGRSLTLRQHHSLVRLPDDGYRPRRFDPRIGVFATSFYDFAKPFDQDYVTRVVRRHRLIKRNPNAAMSEPVKPITYYMDPAIPEPYRSAFKEGGLWWNKVFEAAGFINAFRIEDMPPDMDPMDARYHVIQWVHRSEAGSSVGPSLFDPRTGEIIKVAIRMDSHRSLVDYDIYAGVRPATGGEELDPYLVDPGLGGWVASLDPNVTADQFAMARRRQHSAHEIGHTLGLAHNFVAASYGRASVMDYPAPLIQLTAGGGIDLRDAYRNGAGAYDSIAIRYAYTPFPPAQEDAGLRAIASEAVQRGLKFITNPDEQSSGAFPEASTWINGTDVVEELERVMRVRRALIERFDANAIDPGDPMAHLNNRLTTVYLHHRFTLLAAIKAVGGLEFRYAVRGDPAPATSIVAPAKQRRALELLLDALEPDELAIPERVLAQLAPRAFGYASDRRAFDSQAGHAFDQIGVARTVASLVIGGLFDETRAARVVNLHARNQDVPALEEVIARVIDRTWMNPAPSPRQALRRVAQRVVVDELINLAAAEAATPEARAAAEWGLRRIFEAIQSREPGGPAEQAHEALAWSDIDRFLNRRADATARGRPLPAPAGTPIGGRP